MRGIICEDINGPNQRCIPFGPACDPRCGGYGQDKLGYVAAAEWAETMLQTHDQLQCPGCGLWSIWAPRGETQ